MFLHTAGDGKGVELHNDIKPSNILIKLREEGGGPVGQLADLQITVSLVPAVWLPYATALLHFSTAVLLNYHTATRVPYGHTAALLHCRTAIVLHCCTYDRITPLQVLVAMLADVGLAQEQPDGRTHLSMAQVRP